MENQPRFSIPSIRQGMEGKRWTSRDTAIRSSLSN
nr:MAG TPA: hypothetical protein [Caudoviricetes sp.]